MGQQPVADEAATATEGSVAEDPVAILLASRAQQGLADTVTDPTVLAGWR
jgi:hypothetical protein